MKPGQGRPRRARTIVAAILGVGIAGTLLGYLALTRGSGARPLGPRPNGIIATLERGPSSLPGVDNTDLVAIDPLSGVMRDLTADPAAEGDPAWSPDGTRV